MEILSAGDERDTNIFKYTDTTTYRHFNNTANWKDNLGDWGKLVCAGNHTIIKNQGTILKNYCKGTNKDGDIFWLMMDRKSNDFDSGIGKIVYEKGTGKFEKYDAAQCVYAVTFLPERDGSFIKSKCKLFFFEGDLIKKTRNPNPVVIKKINKYKVFFIILSKMG